MVNRILHRGPDDKGVWHNENIGLGRTRLSILDLSKKGHQPMVDSQSNSVISYNGEVYNFNEIKNKELVGEFFRSRTDTEVVLKSLVRSGKDALAHFQGMFSLAYYDGLSRTLILACDPIGIKPLYYHINKERLIFCSEIKPLFLDQKTPRQANLKALSQHVLYGYALAPLTAFDEIYKLEPGSYLEVTHAGVKKCTYMSIQEFFKDEVPSFEMVENTFDKAMRLHIRADVPCGTLLSGGLDSTLMVASLAMQKKLHSDFKAFNVGTDISSSEGGLYAERRGAILTAKKYNIDLVKVDPPTLPNFNLDYIVNTLEEPMCNPAAILIDQICSQARLSQIPVLLSGHGGDEIFAGYRRHIWARHLPFFRPFYPLISLITSHNKNNLWQKILTSLSPDIPEPLIPLTAIGWDLVHNWNIAPELCPPDRVWSASESFFERLKPFENHSPLKRLMVLDFSSYLSSQNLLVMDKMSMKHSIEVRVPFLYKSLVKVGWNLPDSKLVFGKSGKQPLRNLARKRLSKELLKTKKIGFDFSLKNWVFSEQGKDLLLSEQTRKRSLFNHKSIEDLLKLDLHKNTNIIPLYNLAIIEQWHRTMLESEIN